MILRRLAHLDGVAAETDSDLSAYAARRPGLDARVVGDVLAIAKNPEGSGVDAMRIYSGYIAAVEKLWRFIDRWKAE